MRKRICVIFLLIAILVLDLGNKSNGVYSGLKDDGFNNYVIGSDDYRSANFSYKNHAEGILDYNIDIHVNKDSSMDVKEKIVVNVKGINIKHGIYRDFPIRYKNKSVTFDVKNVLLNGNDVEYKMESTDDGVRLKIGSEVGFVSEGVQEYQIEYTTENQLFYKWDCNELYWNLIGTGWDFDIDKCSAKIYFPKGTSIHEDEIKAYVGTYGTSKEAENVEWSVDSANSAVIFELNDKISSGRAFTVLVRVDKGTISKPSFGNRVDWFFKDKIVYVLSFVGLIGLGVWQYFAWRKHGNKLKRKVIVPKYYPPEGLDVGQVRYLDTMGSTKRVLEATIISLATKGFIRFGKTTGKKKVIFVEKTHEKSTNEYEDELSDNEKFVYSSLAEKDYFMYSSYFSGLVESMNNDLSKDLKARYKNSLFFKNWKYVIISVIATLFIFAIGLRIGKLINPFADSYNFAGLEFICLFILSFSMIAVCFKRIALDSNKRWIVVPIMTVFCIPFLVGEYALLARVFKEYVGNLIDVVMIVLSVVQNYLFMKYIRSYSEKGLKIKEDIAGFKMFIKTVDDNLAEKTPEMFDKYFAYAYALGLENKWAKKFERVLDEVKYTPVWCAEHTFYRDSFNSRTFTADFSSAFAAGIREIGGIANTWGGNGNGSGGSSGGSSGGGGFAGGGGGGRRPEVAGKSQVLPTFERGHKFFKIISTLLLTLLKVRCIILYVIRNNDYIWYVQIALNKGVNT